MEPDLPSASHLDATRVKVTCLGPARRSGWGGPDHSPHAEQDIAPHTLGREASVFPGDPAEGVWGDPEQELENESDSSTMKGRLAGGGQEMC